MEPWHFDSECEKIVDERVKEFICQCSTGHMGDGLDESIELEIRQKKKKKKKKKGGGGKVPQTGKR